MPPGVVWLPVTSCHASRWTRPPVTTLKGQSSKTAWNGWSHHTCWHVVGPLRHTVHSIFEGSSPVLKTFTERCTALLKRVTDILLVNNSISHPHAFRRHHCIRHSRPVSSFLPWSVVLALEALLWSGSGLTCPTQVFLSAWLNLYPLLCLSCAESLRVPFSSHPIFTFIYSPWGPLLENMTSLSTAMRIMHKIRCWNKVIQTLLKDIKPCSA